MILRKVDLGALIGTDIAELAMRIVAALLILVVGLWLVKLLVNLAKKTVFYKKQTTELQSFFASALKALGYALVIGHRPGAAGVALQPGGRHHAHGVPALQGGRLHQRWRP